MNSTLSLGLVAHRGIQRSRNVFIIIIMRVQTFRIVHSAHIGSGAVCPTVEAIQRPNTHDMFIVQFSAKSTEKGKTKNT